MTALFAAVTLLVSVLAPGPASAAGSLTGAVINLRGVPLSDVVVTHDGQSVTTGTDGRFRFEPAAPGPVGFERVGYASVTHQWDGTADWLGTTMAPRVVRALHVTGTVPASDAWFDDMLDIAATTSVNALMIDVKGESGLVFHQSDVATVASVGSAYSAPYDLAARVQQAHAADLYVISRIVTFEDPIAARARPDWAVTTASGALLVHSGQYWLDPTDPDARAYALALALEVCALGVDEVQFDYVRFPTGDKTTMRFDGPADAAGRQTAITSFLAEARARLAPAGCATAADIFGFITNKTHEGGIGQQLEDLAATIDVISPMIYPSHYASGWYGFAVPNNHPGPVVHNASSDALSRMTGSQAILRPWLQDFWYTAAQVEEQIVTVDALGLGWMLWNAASEFTVPGIPFDHELHATDAPEAPTLLSLPTTGFYDVADSDLYATEIGWLGSEGITRGCNPPWADFFCPADRITRGQLAAFLARAFNLALPPTTDRFSDDDGSVFEAEIEAIAAAGITVGCAADRYCPADLVTRGQLASFLARALELDDVDTPILFSDDDGSVHEGAIGALAAAGITNGCRAQSFCPDDHLRRDHMAAFLHRALASR